MNQSRSAIVEIRNLSKSYRRGSQIIPVLENITFEIPDGEFLALMGPSGSGKSTLLNLLAGIDSADAGSILINGVEITTLAETELARWRSLHVGFIFQFYNLIPVLTAFENVELPLLLTRLSRKERRDHVETALRVVGLADRMAHYPSQLSGGQQQRVAIARAVVTDPTILVADEPTGDLDRHSAGEILDLMDRLNRESGKTIIMVTHDPRAAEKAHVIRYLEKLRQRSRDYNGFNIIFGDRKNLYAYSNRGEVPPLLQPGIHGLSNHLLDTPWPKVTQGKKALADILLKGGEPSVEDIFSLLADRSLPADCLLPDTGVGLDTERLLAPLFISGPVYGTRSSSILLIDQDAGVTFIERTHNGTPGKDSTRTIRFKIEE